MRETDGRKIRRERETVRDRDRDRLRQRDTETDRVFRKQDFSRPVFLKIIVKLSSLDFSFCWMSQYWLKRVPEWPVQSLWIYEFLYSRPVLIIALNEWRVKVPDFDIVNHRNVYFQLYVILRKVMPFLFLSVISILKFRSRYVFVSIYINVCIHVKSFMNRNSPLWLILLLSLSLSLSLSRAHTHTHTHTNI